MLVYLIFVAGLALLLFGGDWLVKGAVGLAEKFKISPLIIGLTIVALGTSAPELVISMEAALLGSGELAVGNVVGSNIANVLLVLGVPALFSRIDCNDKAIHTTLFFLIGLTVIFMLQLGLSPLSRLDGVLLLICLAAFLVQQAYNAKRGKEEAEDYHDELGAIPADPRRIAMLLIVGVVLLPVGATLTIDSAIEIATRWSVPQAVIGLTIVAIGTSLPELATSVMAARHNNASVALGNIVGSNLFNIALIMGTTATVAGNVPAGDHIVRFDMWIMLAVTMLLFAFALLKVSIGRMGGLLLTGAYIAYLIVTATT